MIWKYDGAIEIENSAAERDADASIAADPVGEDAEASTNAEMSSRRRRHSAYGEKKSRIISLSRTTSAQLGAPFSRLG
jgi:hypothetical protein